MKTGFIDWTEGRIDLYVFDRQEHIDTISAPLENRLNLASLAALPNTGFDMVCLSVPCGSLSLRELSFPFRDKDSISETIAYELEGLLLGGAGDYAIDHIVKESFDNGCRVMAACIEKTVLSDIIWTFSSSGLEPRIITSIDLRLAGGDIDKLVEGLHAGKEARIEAARNEILHPSINLRQHELAYTGDIERVKKSLRLTSSLALILALIIFTNTALTFTARKKEGERLSSELHAVYRGVFPEDKKILDPVKQFKGNLNILQEKKSIFGGIPLLDILNDIANVKRGNIILIEFNADGKNLIIKGTASSFKEVDSLKNSLSTLFDGAKVTASDATVDRKINFTLLMQEKTL